MSVAHTQTELMENNNPSEISLDQIMRLLPHRPPMLMVERLINVISGESAVGIKTISDEEWYFQGHFPQKPVMPGVMIIEALAQTAATLAMHSINLYDKEHLVYFMGIDEARFRKMVLPGSILHLEVTRTHRRGNVWRFKGVAKVNGEIVAEAIKTAMISDK
ncbi:MAG: 3-hydroxyacyl-[acyl-carrier-protein] dehydratase FabZ [Alphaproteobacteria bacterium 41-28]|nr:MAG: 3-hydroxyacyl-[acyl-carrier-protein] dehydratase FabZ [Alphaproteobacteria bacterium 41-28]